MQALIDALDAAVRDGVTPYQPQPDDVLQEFDDRYFRQVRVNATDKSRAAIIALLHAEPLFRPLDTAAIVIGDESHGLSLPTVTDWLLARAFHRGGAGAVAELVAFVEGDRPREIHVLILSGVTVPSEIRITDAISVVPFEQIPASLHAGHISRYPDTYLPHLDPLGRHPLPSAIVYRSNQPVQLLPERPRNLNPSVHSDTVIDVARCLTLFGPCAPVRSWGWYCVERPELIPISASSVVLGRGPEDIALKSVQAFPGGDVEVVIPQFLALDRASREQLGVSLDRLNLALRRTRDIDKAIELGIALESLLTSDKDSNRPLSYLLRLRGARLGGADAARRQEIAKLLSNVYELRSKAVHQGVFNERQARMASEVLPNGIDLCATLIRIVIARGGIPDWDKFDIEEDLRETPDYRATYRAPVLAVRLREVINDTAAPCRAVAADRPPGAPAPSRWTRRASRPRRCRRSAPGHPRPRRGGRRAA